MSYFLSPARDTLTIGRISVGFLSRTSYIPVPRFAHCPLGSP
ncbi:hypothetical protein [Candidatus Liberibacter sp.]|nr:hypothetical protein [Candidatus Liberibacter sp.]